MKSILEKAIVHLLNGDESKAEALFHRFMVERARQIHESLRQGEDVELTENWDSEITEEEYFDDSDVEDKPEGEEGEGEFPAGDSESEAPVSDEGDVEGDEAAPSFGDEESNFGDPDEEEGFEPEAAEHEDMESKLDSIESKIEELTAEFDRMMSQLDDDMNLGHGDEEGDEFGAEGSDLGDEHMGDDADMGDMSDSMDTEVGPDAGDTAGMADQLEDDMGEDEDEHEFHPEHGMAEDADMDAEADDADLEDITESVLAELDRISAPSNGEGKEAGTGRTMSPNKDSILPSHPVNDRFNQAKPVLVKAEGDAHNDSFDRETPPPKKDFPKRRNNDAGVKKLQKVPAKGDASALINKDFASHSEGKPIIDGSKKIKNK